MAGTTNSIFSSSLPSSSGRLGSFFASLSEDWRYIRIILAALVLWYIGSQIVYIFVDTPTNSSAAKVEGFASKAILHILYFLFLLFLVRLYQFSRTLDRNDSIISALFKAYKADPYQPVRWCIFAVLAVVSFTAFISIFMSVKTAIPEMVPFYFDEAAYKIDRFLFLGHDPWQLLAPLFAYTKVISVIDFFYTAWAAFIAGTWFYCFTSRAMNITRRYQFCLAMILLWIVAGNVVATLLSSAGPVYYEYFTGDATAYAGLMSELARINEIAPLGAVEYHGVLLDMYENSSRRIGGISALPSIHCGSTLLLLITFWKSPLPRLLMIGFTAIIFIGSVLLAWHYAIDGLIVIPMAFACWFAAGWILRKLVPAKTES